MTPGGCLRFGSRASRRADLGESRADPPESGIPWKEARTTCVNESSRRNPSAARHRKATGSTWSAWPRSRSPPRIRNIPSRMRCFPEAPRGGAQASPESRPSDWPSRNPSESGKSGCTSMNRTRSVPSSSCCAGPRTMARPSAKSYGSSGTSARGVARADRAPRSCPLRRHPAGAHHHPRHQRRRRPSIPHKNAPRLTPNLAPRGSDQGKPLKMKESVAKIRPHSDLRGAFLAPKTRL
jgi:hypothetical protein